MFSGVGVPLSISPTNQLDEPTIEESKVKCLLSGRNLTLIKSVSQFLIAYVTLNIENLSDWLEDVFQFP